MPSIINHFEDAKAKLRGNLKLTDAEAKAVLDVLEKQLSLDDLQVAPSKPVPGVLSTDERNKLRRKLEASAGMVIGESYYDATKAYALLGLAVLELLDSQPSS